MKSNYYIPQWQGSGTTSELHTGAAAVKKYLDTKSIPFTEIPVSLSPDGEVTDSILSGTTIRNQLTEFSTRLFLDRPDKTFTLGGGCGVEVPVVSYLSGKYPGMDVIWFDAHGDLNTPESSPSKLFHGMPLRFLLEPIPGNGISDLFNRIRPEDVVLAGVRDLDPPEESYIRGNNIKVLRVDDADVRSLTGFLNPSNEYAYLHIDLDVLDPEAYGSVKCPTPGGISIDELAVMIGALQAEKTVVGMSLLENTATRREEIRKLDRILDLGINL